LGLSHVQLALGPLLGMTEDQRQAELQALRDAGIGLTAGMVAVAGEDYSTITSIRPTGGGMPAETGPQRREGLEQAGQLAAGIGLTAGMVAFAGEDYSTITSIRSTGGVMPDETWPQRREVLQQAAQLAAEIGLKLVSTHLGFIPRSGDPRYGTVLERVQEAA